MKTKPRGHVAAVAVATMVGGLLPFIALAGPASAVEPTSLTVSPSAANVAAGGTATFTGNLVSANGPTQDVFFAVTSGPDADPLAPLDGTLCTILPPATPAGTPFSCDVTNVSLDSGVDNITFFYDAAGTGSFVPANPSATATLTIGGAVDAALLSPTSAQAGDGEYRAYTVSVADADGLPVVGADVTLDLEQLDENGDPVAAGVLDIQTGPPAPADKKVAGAGNGTIGAAELTVQTADGTNGTTAGVATFYVASDQVGTVNVTATSGTPVISSSTGTLTVNDASANAATSVEITPASQNAFSGGEVQFNITVTNATGDPIIGVTPRATVAGVNVDQPVTVGVTDLTGTAVATYEALFPNEGLDTLTAWVDQSDNAVNTGAIDAGEPSGTATVNVGQQNFEADALSSSGAVTVPTEITSAPVTFTLESNDGSSAEGFQLAFTVSGTDDTDPTKYTLSAENGLTDANGQVTVTVTNSAPADLNTATITATLIGAQVPVTDSETVTWEARAAQNPVIAPAANTSPTEGTTTFTATTTDAFGDPVEGITYSWLVIGRNNATNNTGVTGTGDSFTYTDTGPANIGGEDTVIVTSMNATGGVIGTDTATQYWIIGNALAAQANIDLPPYAGVYDQAGLNTPFIATGFTKEFTFGVNSDPTPVDPEVEVLPVTVKLIDSNGNPLFGKSVSFTSSGVGGFSDVDGVPIGNSTTALVSDEFFSPAFGSAVVYVRSTQVGIQTITATVDGIVDTAEVTYSGQYVPVEPIRVADSRNYQGGIADWNGNPVVDGRLAPNTLYYFDYDTTVVPQDQAAIAFNITGIQPSDYGNLRVAPACEDGTDIRNTDVPTTSLLNYQIGEDIANFAVIPNGFGCDEIKIYSDNSSVAVAIDLNGYYPTTEGIESIPTTRVADTRTGLGGGSGPVEGGTSRSFQIAGTAGIPLDAKAVALNVTAIQPDGQGNLRVYPSGAEVPNASNINYIPLTEKAAFVVVNLPADGKISVYSDGATADVAIDAFAYYPDSSTMVTGAPVRIFETRDGGTALAANTARSFQVAGVAGVPVDAQAVLVSVTGIHTAGSTGSGNLRIYPAGEGVPVVSTLNYVSPDTDVANFAIVKLGAGGQLSLFSDGSPIDAAVDVVGFIPAGGSLELN